MINFTLQIPTKIVFGKGVIDGVGGEAAKYGNRVLLLYGGGSIKKNGVYETVSNALNRAGLTVIEYPGVKPNPLVAHAEAGVKLARREKVDLIVAAGGGSVIDEGKAIAIGATNPPPLWNYYTKTSVPKKALPLIAVQTLPATSSEMNMAGVLTNKETGQKFSCRSPLLYPKVAFLDPAVTVTIPPVQTAYACTDILSHVMEGYFTATDSWPVVQLGFAEGIMRSVRLSMERLLENFEDIEARSAIMWAGALSWNGMANAGLQGAGIPNHMLEHPFSRLYDIPHGAGLSMIIPAWLKYRLSVDGGELTERLRQFAGRVFDVKDAESMQPEKVIELLEEWYRKIGTPVSLGDAGITEPLYDELIREALELCELWNVAGYSAEIIEEIYRLAL